MNITIKYARLPHGLVYYYQHWVPEQPRALVIVVHGLGDHIGRYGDLIARLTKAQYACALFDQQGHGRSEGRRGHVERFSDWVGDLASFIHFSEMSVPSDTPLFIAGVGLGALIGINYLLTHSAPVDGMVAISAAIMPTVRIPEWRKRMARRLARFVPSLSIGNGMDPSNLTRDAGEFSALAADPLFHRRMTIGAALEIERNLELVMAMPHRIHVPMILLAGEEDSVCDPQGTRLFAERLSSSERIYRIYPGMYHDLLHDEGREDVFDDIDNWIGLKTLRLAPAGRQMPLRRRETLWENVSPPAS